LTDSPEKRARQNIDAALTQAGWVIQDARAANIHAGWGVAVREFPLERGHGYADYLLYVDGKATGVIEAKKEGTPLTEVEVQSEKYSHGMPSSLPAWIHPLPFLYQSTGIETRFTNLFDPDPRSRRVFHFYRPETFADWLNAPPQENGFPSSLRSRLQLMPPLVETLLHLLWRELDQLGCHALLVQPLAERIHRPDPAVTRDRFHSTFAEVNHEPLHVGASDDR
jgi:type I restriction enzyme, R subunit